MMRNFAQAIVITFALLFLVATLSHIEDQEAAAAERAEAAQ